MIAHFKESQTRFLAPFEFDPRAVAAASDALRSASILGASAWIEGRVPRSYRDEVLEHARDFLFGGPELGCAYLVLDPPIGDRWLSDREVEIHPDARTPFRLVPGAAIELFLSPFGVGVLSVTLAPSTRDLTQELALDFNYRLAQHRRRAPARARKRHRAHDRAAFEALSPADRERVGTVPASDAPLASRLGIRGGEFHLVELVDLLLEPLRRLHLRAVQDVFSVFTVARLGPRRAGQVPLEELADLRTPPGVGPFLSALCQVEESRHAGAPPGEVTAITCC